jgi:prepilin-type N-terminal cleavage/methylation domain-containing protein
MRRSRRGFTLIEVMVALTLGAVVVLLVHQSFATAADTVTRLDDARREHGTRMEAQAYVTRAFGSLAIGTPGARGFEGLPDRVTFSTQLDAARAPTQLTIAVADSALGVMMPGRAFRPLEPAAAVGFDYLLSYGSQASWVQGWHSPVSAPLAVRARIARSDGTTDTLLLLIGPRG